MKRFLIATILALTFCTSANAIGISAGAVDPVTWKALTGLQPLNSMIGVRTDVTNTFPGPTVAGSVINVIRPNQAPEAVNLSGIPVGDTYFVGVVEDQLNLNDLNAENQFVVQYVGVIKYQVGFWVFSQQINSDRGICTVDLPASAKNKKAKTSVSLN